MSAQIAWIVHDRLFRFYVYAIALFAVLFTTSGGFDTDEISVAHRVALWTVLPSLVIFQTAFIARTFGAAWKRRDLRRSGVQSALLGMLIVIFVTVLVALEVHVLKFTPLVPHDPDPIFGFILFMAPTVAPVSVGVVIAEFAFRDIDQPDLNWGAKRSPNHGWPTAPIAWVRVHDHYLKIKTTTGQTVFVRGKMKDVVTRLAKSDVDGLQIHRSWWVARAALLRIERRGRDLVAVLIDGEEASIGRTRIDDLRARGWL